MYNIRIYIYYIHLYRSVAGHFRIGVGDVGAIFTQMSCHVPHCSHSIPIESETKPIEKLSKNHNIWPKLHMDRVIGGLAAHPTISIQFAI